MILSDVDIAIAIKNKDIIIENWPNNDIYIGPSSIDLHLDNKSMILDEKKFNNSIIDTKIEHSFKNIFTPYDNWKRLTIYPGEFYLLSTIEKITFSKNMAGFMHGRSSLARLGINVHSAGFFDPGFSGTATLEVTNFTKVPIILDHKIRICQMIFIPTQTSSLFSYDKKDSSKYKKQMGPTLSKIHKDF